MIIKCTWDDCFLSLLFLSQFYPTQFTIELFLVEIDPLYPTICLIYYFPAFTKLQYFNYALFLHCIYIYILALNYTKGHYMPKPSQIRLIVIVQSSLIKWLLSCSLYIPCKNWPCLSLTLCTWFSSPPKLKF